MYFIANWKMHGNTRDIERSKPLINLANQKKYKKCKIIYCPPYTLLKTFYEKVKKTKVEIGAQNLHQNSDFGPFTGSVNSKLIKSTGAKYIIIGHSDNRIDGDTDFIINKKIKSAINENLKVIFCVGEKLSEKKKNLTLKILKKQLIKGLYRIKNFEKIIITYEPVWSIGTGIVPKNKELKKNIEYIKSVLDVLTNSRKMKILYGGSVNPKNVRKLTELSEIDGFLVGGSSLNANKFIDIIKKSII